MLSASPDALYALSECQKHPGVDTGAPDDAPVPAMLGDNYLPACAHVQDSLRNSSSSAPDEDTLTSPSTESMAIPHRQHLPDRLASPDKEPQAGGDMLQRPERQSRERNRSASSDVEKQRREPDGTEEGFLFQREGGQSAALLDTTATLSDWILRSASSSAGPSLRGSEAAEAEAGAGPLAAESAGVPSQLLDSLASLSDWAHGGDGPRHKEMAPGGHQLGLISHELQHRHCLKGAKEALNVSMVCKPERYEHGPLAEKYCLHVQVRPGWVQALPASLWLSQTAPCQPCLISRRCRQSSRGGRGTLGSLPARLSSPPTAWRSPARHAAAATWRTLQTQGPPSLSCTAPQAQGPER